MKIIEVPEKQIPQPDLVIPAQKVVVVKEIYDYVEKTVESFTCKVRDDGTLILEGQNPYTSQGIVPMVNTEPDVQSVADKLEAQVTELLPQSDINSSNLQA